MRFYHYICTDSKLRIISILLMMSGICCFLLLFRIFITHQTGYIFLVWNLFLAFLPVLVSFQCNKYYNSYPRRYLLVFPLILLWLLFFPNSPYIITDIIHMGPRPNIPKWFDAILLFSFATTGLLFGLFSLYLIHEVFEKMLGKKIGWAFISLTILLSSYGIYFGRVLRWNSWDLFLNPFNLLSDIIFQIGNQAAAMMGLTFTIFLLSIYIVFLNLIDVKK